MDVEMQLSTAALLAIGVGIGLHISRPVVHPVASVVVIQPAPEETSRPAAEDGGFWSSRRFIACAQQEKREDTSPLHWTSPVKMPDIGEIK